MKIIVISRVSVRCRVFTHGPVCWVVFHDHLHVPGKKKKTRTDRSKKEIERIMERKGERE